VTQSAERHSDQSYEYWGLKARKGEAKIQKGGADRIKKQKEKREKQETKRKPSSSSQQWKAQKANH
jgi:hypothetical protein